MTFGEVGYLSRPVVHLYVYVAVIITFPWRIVHVVPQSLQIGWHRAAARRAYHQIVAILETEHVEIVIVFVIAQQLVGGHRGNGVGKLKLHTSEQAAVVLHMARTQPLICQGACPLHTGRHTGMQSAFVATDICGRREVEISSGCEHHRHGVGTAYHQPSVLRAHRSTLSLHHRLCLIVQQVELSADKKHVATGHGLPTLAVNHAQREVETPAAARRAEPHHDYAVGVAGEIFALIPCRAYDIAHPPHCLVE